MPGYTDLEIGLYRWDAESYAVDLRVSEARGEADIRLGAAKVPPLARFAGEALNWAGNDPVTYGQRLGEAIFSDPGVYKVFSEAVAAADSQGVPLRLRLYLPYQASVLQGLRWETMRDPQDGTPLFTGRRIHFSRYLSRIDWRKVDKKACEDLRALVVVANPSDLSEWQPGGRTLDEVNVPDEIARATAALGPKVQVTALDSGGKATLEQIGAELRSGYEILYLVAHGAVIEDVSTLWLEDAEGKTATVAGADLAARIGALNTPPQLVVLASCQSAGTGAATDSGAMSALGPQIAEAGVPAVLAMQGNVSMETAAAFMPVFFSELVQDGRIDRAVAEARNAVRDRPDAWMPALFMRLKSGRIWYQPGFTDEGPDFKRWRAVLSSVREGTCIPVVGVGLVEPIIGSRRALAVDWAAESAFPMAPHAREDLPQVAQFVAVDQDYPTMRSELGRYMRANMRKRNPNVLANEPEDSSLDRLISVAGANWRNQTPDEPHAALAKLGLPIYVTANFDSLLEDAITAGNRTPQVEIAPWNDRLAAQPPLEKRLPGYQPTPDQPLVYHVFGRLTQPDSLVITEDDYFDYLIGITHNNDMVLPALRAALSGNALLFLGFQMDDWSFRVLFRSLMRNEGRDRRSRYTHVAVQVDPDEGTISDVDQARQYLDGYFEYSEVVVYWGSVQDFIKELQRRWQIPPI